MKKYISPFLLFSGVLLLAISVFIGYYVVPYKVWENIVENSRIVKGNTRYEKWVALPENLELLQKIYFFNVTNPEEVVKGGKPVLQELGPYVYQQKRRKFNIVFNENGTIFYREKTHFFFRPELTNGSLSDRITFVNIPYVSAARKAAENSFLRYVVSDTLRNFPEEQLYMHTTVGKILFEGTYMPFIKELAELRGEEVLPNNTFGLYFRKNGTDQGRFEIFSGEKNPDYFGNVASWNGRTSLDWWEDKYCNQINGSDGGIFRPYSNKERVFQMFIPGLCKSFRFEYEDETGIKVKGIPVLKFVIKPSFFASPKTNPDNACYCVDPGQNFENCLEDGAFALGGCGKGAMVLSQPHFYQGSHFYLNQSVGLKPDKDRHEMALYIETYTSAAAKVSIRFQMNVALQPDKFFRPLRKVPKMVHPVFYIDQTVELPEDSAALLRDKLYGTVYIANVLTQLGIIVGLSSILASLLIFCLCFSRPPKKAGDLKDTVETVSYHPKGGMSNGIIEMKANGKLPNGSISNGIGNAKNGGNTKEQRHPLLKQTISPKECLIDTGDKTPIQNDSESFTTFNSSDTSRTDTKSPNDLSKEPDSRLNPFPVLVDFSSSSSIGTSGCRVNTLRDVIDATSSYENL